MTTLKNAIATIATETGAMTIYYNGDNQPLTAEGSGLVEQMDYTPKNLDDAGDYVYASYQYPDWELEMIEL